MGKFIEFKEDQALVRVLVSPGAKKDKIAGEHGDKLKISVAAEPEKGNANKRLIEFLSSELDCPRSDITVTHGHTSRTKLLILRGRAFKNANKLCK